MVCLLSIKTVSNQLLMSGAHTGSRCTWQGSSVLILIAANHSYGFQAGEEGSIHSATLSIHHPPIHPLTVPAKETPPRWRRCGPCPQGAHTKRCPGRLRVMPLPPGYFLISGRPWTRLSSSANCPSIMVLSQLITPLFPPVSWVQP